MLPLEDETASTQTTNHSSAQTTAEETAAAKPETTAAQSTTAAQTASSTRMGRKGGQFGILKVEDYSGSYEFMLFGQNFIDYNKYGIVGTPIMVRGAYQQRFNSDIKFNVQSISLLEDVKGKVVHNILIHINDDELEKAKVITPFMTASTENRCDLYFRVQDVDHQRFVDLKSKAKIPVSKKLLDTLDEANIRYKINADF